MLIIRVVISASACISVLVLLKQIEAHPGAIAEGRGSCGEEFDTAAKAFHIPDISEAWYVRRVGTCSHPFFWVSFDTTEADQKVTFVAASPEVEQFQDKLKFTAVLFGPSYGSDTDLPASLEEWQVPVPVGLGWKVLTSPDLFSSCDFLQNPVMRNYKKLTDGRCMEHMTMAADFKKPALAGKTWNNWWLASHDLKIPTAGRHYVVIWVTDRMEGTVISGRIEVTLGPWTWYGYASDSTQKQAQSQTTTCSCATNHAAWYTQNLDMIGNVSPSLFSSQLPFQKCSVGGQDLSSCRASIKSAKISGSNDSSIEWAGVFELSAGTYDWDFFSFKHYDEWRFPDATMDVIIIRSSGTGTADLEGVESAADAAMTSSLADAPAPKIVSPGGTMTAGDSTPAAFRVSLPEPTSNVDVNVTFKVIVPTSGSYAIFTQHRPAEFMAEQLTCNSSCAEGSAYVFWKSAKTYGVRRNTVDESIQTSSTTVTSSSPPKKASTVSSAPSVWLVPLANLLWFSLQYFGPECV